MGEAIALSIFISTLDIIHRKKLAIQLSLLLCSIKLLVSQRMTNAATVTEKKSNKQVCTTTKFIIGGIVCFHDDQQTKNLVPGNISIVIQYVIVIGSGIPLY